jgi:serine/threonine protein kinase
MGDKIRCASCGFDGAEEGAPCPSCKTEDPTSGVTAVVASTLTIPRESTPVTPSQSQYHVGDLYADRYRIQKFLGKGGMGSVYRVVDQATEQVQALKILSSAAGEGDGGARFKREIEILAKLDHPAVPKVYGWGLNEGELYFLCEYIDGRDLKAEIKTRGPWPAAEAAELAARVADVLAFAHSRGIIHRDVKPNNVMIGKDNTIFLLDFGVARASGQGMETLTRTGMVIGTPDYMSPEQFSSNRVDERSDIYSLGVLLYELVTGQMPFEGETPIAIAMKHIQEIPSPPRLIRKDVPAWLERLILKCLEKDRKNRFGSAAELATELRKTRGSGKPRLRWLPTGDAIVEDDSESSDWVLVLSSFKPKEDWFEGMGLRFEERLYQLGRIDPPPETAKAGRWTYNFSFWPQDQVFRRLVDYEKDCADRAAAEAVRQAEDMPFYRKIRNYFKSGT